MKTLEEVAAILEREVQRDVEQSVFEYLESITSTQRRVFFDQLRSQYCLNCGDSDPRCQCWNDE